MSNDQVMWIDAERCTGCGACIEVCPVGAIALVDDVARVDDKTCTGCEACLDVCPEDAIRPVVEGQLVRAEDQVVERRRAEERLAPVVDRRRSLVETAGPAVAAIGVGLVARVADALVQAVGRWLAERPTEGATPGGTAGGTGVSGRRNGQDRRLRRRRRGH